MTTITDYAIVIQRVADTDAWCDVAGRRIAAVAAVLVFSICYIAGLLHFGLLLGISVGWLPCAVAAWVAALVIAPCSTALLRMSVSRTQETPGEESSS